MTSPDKVAAYTTEEIDKMRAVADPFIVRIIATLDALRAERDALLAERDAASRRVAEVESRAALPATPAPKPDVAWTAMNTAAESTSLGFLSKEPDLYDAPKPDATGVFGRFKSKDVERARAAFYEAARAVNDMRCDCPVMEDGPPQEWCDDYEKAQDDEKRAYDALLEAERAARDGSK